MKNFILLSFLAASVFSTHAQEIVNSNANPLNITRQGFGVHNGLSTNLGFVNPDALTDGSAYYFEDWDNSGTIYTKSDGNVKLKQVNINLYYSTLEAIYDDKSIFTFDSENLMRIVVNGKVFRTFEMDGEIKILEQFYNKGISIYKFHKVSFVEASVNPLHNRKKHKYITDQKYYLYKDGELRQLKLSKKAFAKTFQTEKLNEKAIADYIVKSKISLKKEEDLKKVFQFISR